MGCDIHMFVEKYHPVINKWVKVGMENYKSSYDRFPDDEPYAGRNYILFSKLANCGRGDEGSVLSGENKGVPHNCSEQILELLNDFQDAHSVNFYTLKELTDNLDFFKDAQSDKFIDVIQQMKKRYQLGAKKYHTPLEHIRIVFWFDN